MIRLIILTEKVTFSTYNHLVSFLLFLCGECSAAWKRLFSAVQMFHRKRDFRSSRPYFLSKGTNNVAHICPIFKYISKALLIPITYFFWFPQHYTKAARTVPRWQQHRKPSTVRVFSTALDLVYGSDAWREGVWPFLSLKRGVISLRGKREHRIYVMHLTVRVLIR